VRPRDPWMLNRAVVQPVPEVFLGMVADVFEAAESAASLDAFFGRLEDADIMLRVDGSVMPTMARAPTLAGWELELLRTIEHVVRLGHIRRVSRRRIELEDGSIETAGDTVVVHCAGEGLLNRPLVPIWSPGEITLQPVRSGFPCFGAAVAGYVEATRRDDDEKNRLCPPSPYPDSMAAWVRMTAVGARNAMSFGAEPDIAAWASTVAINPARIAPGSAHSAELDDVLGRLQAHTRPGVARLMELSGGTVSVVQ
ncbi:MAG TPA: pyridine nucleotide-disulfide oxidoreductase, partial [Agromyces sp.]